MSSLDESDVGSEYSDDDIAPEAFMDIDPELSTMPATNDMDDMDSLSDDIITFTDDEDDEDYVLENEYGNGDDLRDNLRLASGFKLKKQPKSQHYGKRRAMRDAMKAMDPEALDYLSKANTAYVNHKLDEAAFYCQQAVKIEPKHPKPYNLLGLISEEKGDLKKACSYSFMAAELTHWSSESWFNAAKLSKELGYIDQAIYCYTQIINLKGDSRELAAARDECIQERSMLYKEKGQYGRALEGLQKLHLKNPKNETYVKNLASVYVEQKRINDAVNLYMRILDSNMKQNGPPPFDPVFGWSELNILCELFLTQHSWRMGVKIIKTVARWINNRTDEVWWDDQDDDCEFDSRRAQMIHKKRPSDYNQFLGRDFELPIDLRFKLGCFRLELDQKEEALSHFRSLFAHTDRYDVVDLFFDAGRNLEKHGYYKEALEFLEELSRLEESSEASVLKARCYMELFEYDHAKRVLLEVISKNPDDLDLKLMLAEAFLHTEDTENARKLIIEVEEKKALLGVQDEEELEDDVSEEPSLAIIRNSATLKMEAKPTDEERNKAEDHATRLVKNKFGRMQRILQSLDKSGKVGAATWLKLADQLIETFTGVRSFFPKNRKTTFKGIPIYRRKQSLAISDQLSRLKYLADDMAVGDSSRLEMTSKTEFRGLTYDEWLSVFIQYSFLLRYFKHDLDGAVSILEEALTGSVFSQNKSRSMLLRLSLLIFGILQEDFTEAVSNNVRYLLTSAQFSPTIYDFFMCCFSSGVGAWAAFSNYNHQKYFLRQLKAYDSLLTSSKVSGSAHVTIDTTQFSFTREHPQLLYIYACLLGSNRTFSSPIVYLTRVYRQYNQDPTICFMLGLAHVHRSMQRNSNNRHLQLLQGISYLLEYKESREKGATIYEKQEIEYNFGRLFHMLGLPTLAIHHYTKVLGYHDDLIDDPTYDMLMEAAYNLSLIYTINGNTALAHSIYDKYLTI